MPHITPASFKDINDVHNRVPEFDTWNILDWEERCAKRPCRAVMALQNDHPAGYMVSYDRYQDGSMYCWMTAVLPEFRQHGILSAMMDDLVKWAKENVYVFVTIKTRNCRREMLTYLVKSGFDIVSVDPRQPVSDTRIFLSREI